MKYVFLICFLVSSISARCQTHSRETNNNVHYTDSTARIEIMSIYKMLQNGYDFSSLAVRYSQDPGSYKAGGELGFSSLNNYVEEYRQVATSLAVMEVSKPFKTDFGYHIVQLIAKKEGLYDTRHILLRVD